MRTVLILEDNPGIRTALRAILEQNGCRVLEAADQEAAIRICTAQPVIDLLVADVLLRSDDGPQTARKLKALHPRMPILFMSGYPVDTLLNRGLLESAEIERDGFAFLRKPFTLSSFLETVGKLAGPRRPTILVVDDEAAVRQIVCQFLRRREFETLEAGDGHAALDLVTRYRGPIHLLITDIVMPGMNGWDLAGRLLAERPGMKVLYVSGFSEEEAAGARLDGNSGAFLAKPFAMGTLLAKVEQMLGARRSTAAE